MCDCSYNPDNARQTSELLDAVELSAEPGRFLKPMPPFNQRLKKGGSVVYEVFIRRVPNPSGLRVPNVLGQSRQPTPRVPPVEFRQPPPRIGSHGTNGHGQSLSHPTSQTQRRSHRRCRIADCQVQHLAMEGHSAASETHA